MRMVLISEFAVPVADLGGFTEAQTATLEKLIPFLLKDLKSQMEELGLDEAVEEALDSVQWKSAEFTETDSSNIGHAGAYYQVTFSLEAGTVAMMAGFQLKEFENTEDPDTRKGNWMIQIPVEGPIKFLSDKMEFSDIQKYVNGYVQVVGVTYRGRRGRMAMNEEGNVMGLKINPRATDLAPEYGVIVGNVVVVLGHKL